MVRQIYRTQTLVEDFATEIMDLTQGLQPPHAIICDHDAEGRATFERHTGYLTVPAYKSIQPGIQGVKSRLSSKPEWDNGPGLFMLRDSLVGGVDKKLEAAGRPTAGEMEWEGYVWDEKLNRLVNSPKDELPMDKDNHFMDNARYMIAFADSLAEDPEEEETIMLYNDAEQISLY